MYGAYAATANEDFAGYGLEYGPYVGYRGAFGGLTYDATAYYYVFDNDVESYTEFTLALGYSVTTAFAVGGYVGYAPDIEDGFETDQLELGVDVSYATGFSDVSILAEYGTVTFETPGFGSFESEFWSVGVGMPLGSSASLEARYHGSDVEGDGSADDLFTIAISTDFGLL